MLALTSSALFETSKYGMSTESVSDDLLCPRRHELAIVVHRRGVLDNLNEASICLEATTAQIFDLFDDLWLHTQSTLSRQRDMTSLGENMENCLVRAALRTVELVKSHLESIQETRHKLGVWTSGFASTPNTPKSSISDLSTHMFFCVWIWVKAWCDPTATLIDRFYTQFEPPVSLCEQYVETHIAKTPFLGGFFPRGSSPTARFITPPAFSLGSSVVTCLIAIVKKCRDSSIRQRCISTLRKIDLRGVFDTEYLATYLLASQQNASASRPASCPRMQR